MKVKYEDLFNNTHHEHIPTTVIFPDGIEIYYHPDLLKNLIDMKKSVKDMRDIVVIIFGYVGSGKSKLSRQICKFFNPDFGLKNICFNHKDLFELSLKSPPETPVNFDESGESGTGDSATSGEGKKLLQFLRVVRQYQTYQVWCIPDLWELRKQIVMQRCDLVILVEEEPNPEYNRWNSRSKPLLRGKYKVYDKHLAKKLYKLGKDFHDVPKGLNPSFMGDYSGTDVVDEAEYDKKKDLATKAYFYETDKNEALKAKVRATMLATQRQVLINFRAYWETKGVRYTLDELGKMLFKKEGVYAGRLLEDRPMQESGTKALAAVENEA